MPIELIHEDSLLRNACLTDVQWRALLVWASTQTDEVHRAVNRAREYAGVVV